MANRPRILDFIRLDVVKIYQELEKERGHPPSGTEVHGELLAKQGKRLNPVPLPSLRTVQLILTEARPRLKEEREVERPWSTATLVQPEHAIPPAALPAVLRVWKSRVEKGDTFTIREAKWAARLSGLLEDIEVLSHKASQYARTELIYELIDRPFNSTGLDRLLVGLPMPITDWASFLPLLAEQEEDTERGIKDGVEQVKDFVKEGKHKKGGTK